MAVVDDGPRTVHELGIRSLKRRHPGLKTSGLYGALRGVLLKRLLEHGSEKDVRDELLAEGVDCGSEPVKDHAKDIVRSLAQRMPDAFVVEGFTVTIFEVEDSSRLSIEKLRDYALNWFYLDSALVNLRLVVTDRYGSTETELGLCDLYYEFY